ncbi:MAG: glycosyltransferase family 4 protein [Anaerolineae bacterium]
MASATRKYRILMIAPTSFFSDYGCSVRILEEARALQRLGDEVSICTYRNGQDVADLDIRRTLSIPFREHYVVGSSPHKIGFDLLLFWTVLFAALRRRPDIIHAHMHEGALIGLVIGFLLRIPMIFDFQGSLTSEMVDHKFLRRDGWVYRPLRWLETKIDLWSPVILTSSHNAEKLLVEEFGCKPDKIYTVADRVDPEAFFPASDEEESLLARRRQSLRIPPARKVIAYLGLLAEYQGTDVLLEAARQVLQRQSEVHFLIMGFPAVEHYRHKAHQLGIADHCTFTGVIPYPRARDYLAVGDVAVAPKLSATEGNGKILNYMAMAMPTVAFDVPVSREYLGEQGIYATAGDAAALARGLLEALEGEANPDRGLILRRRVQESYSWDSAAEVIHQTYELALDHQHTS